MSKAAAGTPSPQPSPPPRGGEGESGTTSTPTAPGHPAAPVFSLAAFLLVIAGVFGAAAAAPILHALLGESLGAPPALATGLAALGAAAVGAALGAIAAFASRRLAVYEIAAAVLLWVVAVAAVVAAGPAARLGPAVSALEAQGTLVVVLGLTGAGLLAAVAVFTGSTLAYLVAGTGRLDLSLSYELFVARSHLRLNPRTLLALLGITVTGLLPGLLGLLVWSVVADARERAAYRRGELSGRHRMPATLLMTLISIGGVALGVWALTVVLSVMSGFEADLKRKTLGQTAHGILLSYGQDEFGDWREIRTRALRTRGVTGATPFLYNEVMLANGQNLTGAIAKGIDVETVGTVIELPENVEEGRLEWLADPALIPTERRRPPIHDDPAHEDPAHDGPAAEAPAPPPGEAAAPPARGRSLPGIVIGRELAASLRVFVGDQVNVISPFGDLGPGGPQPKARPFRVAAIFYSGMYEYDSKFAYLDLAEAQRFFGAGETVTGLELAVQDVDEARAVLQRLVVDLGGWPYRAKDWGELNRSLFSALQMEKVVMAVILGFIVLVATFTIVSTLIMLVLEKNQEIAVLKSMGAGVPSIMKIFVLEGVAIGGIGTLLGLALGFGSCLLIDEVGIPLDPQVYYIDNLPVLIEPAQFALVALAALVLSYLATIYPATKAARLHPVDGLRGE